MVAVTCSERRTRSEERRVGKECRSRWSPYQQKKKKNEMNHFPVPFVDYCAAAGAAPTIVNQKACSPKRLHCYLILSTVMSVNVFFSSGRRHTRFSRDWSSDVCSSD